MKNNCSNRKTSIMNLSRFEIIASLNRFRSKSILLLMVLLGCISNSTYAQLSGIKTIPGDYGTIAAAVTALNGVGVGAGGVTFNVAAGHTENITAGINITTAGAAGNPIVFMKSGVGANPVITRTDAGTNTTSTFGGLGDAIIRIDGTDFLSFDGIDLSATNQGIEYGYFTSKTVTNACQNLTIKNGVITMTKGTSAYVIGIHIGNGTISTSTSTGVTVSANSGRTENVTITGNTIQNVHGGIYCRGASSLAFYDQNFVIGSVGAGNIIRNFGGGSSTTTYGVYFIYTNNASVDYNTIDNMGGGGSAHASTFYGVFYSTVTGVISGSNNAITMNTSGTSAAHGMYNSSLVTSNNFSNNTFAGTIGATTTSHLIYASSATPLVTIDGNSISGSFSKTGSSGTFYCYYNLGSPASGLETITNNNFSNITSTGTGITSGIFTNTAVGQSRVCHTNTISNWTIGSTSTSYGIYVLSAVSNQVYNNTVYGLTGTSSGSIVGLYFTGTNPAVYNNSIYNLTCNTATAMYGMQVAGTGTVNFYSNRIYNLTNNNVASTASNLLAGVHVSTNGTTTNIYNNLIGDLNAPNSISNDAIRGINFPSTTASTALNLSFNTIYLNASSIGINFGTTGIFHTTSATATSGNLTMRNNIVYNSSTAAGTGVVAAYRRSTIATANYNAASDKNIFYGSNAAPNQVLFTDGVVFNETIGDYQLYMSAVGADQNSYEENVVFTSTSGASVDFLKFDISSPSIAESGGSNVSGITDDYLTTIRQGNPGYLGTGSNPDVGAWELEGTATGGCSGAPALANAQSSNNNPCTNGNFTLSLDILFGVGYAFQWEESTTGPAGPYTPIVLANSASYSTSTNVDTWYRSIVTCVASTQSTTSTEVAISISTLNGTYLIDNTGAGDYLSFDAAADDLACKGVSGPVTFNVTAGQVFNPVSDLVFTFTGNGVNTITFQRTGAGANPLISRAGTVATTDFIIRLNGVDYYTFDGIDLEQTGTSSTDWTEYGIYITNASSTNGSQNNTFKNGTITLSNFNSNAKGVYLLQSPSAASVAGTNSNNKFLNMNVQNAWEGYRFIGASTNLDSGNEIGTTGGGSSSIHTIGDGVTTGSVYGIFGTYQANFRLDNTDVYDINAGGTSLVYGITMQTSALQSATVKNNRLYNINGGGTLYGIYFSSADTVDISNNEIYALASTGSSSSVRGIYVTATGVNSNINANRVYNIVANGITTTSAAGIDVGTGLSHDITNNMVSDIRASASTQTAAGSRGISVTGGSTGGVVRIYHNTVLLDDISTVAANTSAAIHNSSTTPTLDIRNNIFINNTDISAFGTRVAAFWKTASTDNVDNASNNNIYYAGSPDATHLIYYDVTNSAQILVDYQALAAIAPGENVSFTENTAFDPIVNGVIRPDAGIPTYAESRATPLASVTTDFEAGVRSLATPDMGADEGTFTFRFPPLPDCVNYVSPANSAIDICSYSNVQLKWTAAITGGPATLGYDVYFGTNPSPGFVTNVSTLFYNVPSLLPNTTYYWQIIPKNLTGDASGCSIQSFTTIDAGITGITGDTRCGSGTVNLSASGSGSFNWYTTASGGTPIFVGPAYSPNIPSTTDYWVSASNGGTNANVGPASPAIGSNASSTIAIGTQQMFFNVLAGSMTINSVKVFPTATIGSSFTIVIQNSALATVYSSGPILTTVTGGVTAQIVNLNAVLPAGTGYRFGFSTNPGMIRNSTGAVYPYTIPGVVSITGNSFDPVYYYFFYDWSISSGCESPRQMVTGTVLPTTTYYTDADGDTYGDPASPVISCTGAPIGTVADNTDCNDANNAINPAAIELCNGVDDNCAGGIDEGCAVLTFYADADTDTYGDPASFITQTSVTPPAGYVVDNTDCNDGNAAVNPAATEVCNGIDDDCNSLVDDGLTFITYYVDGDGDGFGAGPGSSLCANPGVGYSTLNTDCNDASAAVNPAATEVCNGIDDDCNSLVDDGLTFITYYVDGDGDGFGAGPGSSLCANPGVGYSTVNTDCNDASAGVNPAATEVCNLIDDDCDASIDEGFDVDGDGYTSCNGDCDDNNNTINPGATELCNGIDDNCNGLTDDNVPALPNVGAISGTAAACLPGLSGSTVYSVAPVSGATTYSWSVPAGFTISSGQGTVSVTVAWTGPAIQSGISGLLCVVASDACVSSAASCLTIDYQVAAPVTPPSISGAGKVCPGDVVVYSIASVARATSYTWSVPATMTISSGQGSNVVTVTVNPGYIGGSISVTASNVCGTSPARSKSLLQNFPSTPTAIQGQKEGLCNTVGNNFSIPAVVNATSYNWGISGGTIASGQGTLAISADVAALIGSGSITVQAVNGCGSSSTRSLTILGAPGRPSPITGSASVCDNTTEAYGVATVAGASSYTWVVTPNGSVSSGQGTKNITIDWTVPAIGQTMSVTASNACGTSLSRSLTGITVNNCPRFGANNDAVNLNAYPNPTSDRVTIEFTTQEDSDYNLIIADLSGRTVVLENSNAKAGWNSKVISLDGIASGVYMITLDMNTTRQQLKLVVN